MKQFKLKTFRMYLRRGLIGLCFIVAVVLITNAIFIFVRGERLEEKLAAIRTAGDPVSFSQLAPTAIPPERNAAVFLGRAQVGIENISKELFNVYNQPGFIDGSLSASDLKAIESALQGSPKIIPLLKQSADCTEYDPRIDYTVDAQGFIADSMSRLNSLRAVNRLLTARVHLLISQRNGEAALQTCLAMFRLARLIDREPITGYLVSLACRSMAIQSSCAVLRAGPLQKSTYDALDAELARHDNTDAYVRTLKTERVLGIESFTSIRANTGYLQIGFLRDECDYLDLISEQLEFASRPYSAVVAADLNGRHQGRIGPLSQTVLPALLQCRKACDRTRAKLRCLRVLNAIHSRLAEGDGSVQKVTDLGLPRDATTDPFSEAPLKLKKTAAGWIVYSIGENLKDDGGDFNELHDIGVGPITPNKGDR